MDRAHRLGQKRTVTVYRLLMRHTLEDKIMGLQRFKLDIANAAINQDNVSLSAMDTSKLLDLFTASNNSQPSQQPGEAHGAPSFSGEPDTGRLGKASKSQGGLKGMMKGLEDLADESQYAEEFSLSSFMKKLGQA